MTEQRKTHFPHGMLVEYILLIAVLASVAWMARFFFKEHYLQQPFLFDTNDTFMDWFNTAVYAYRPGAFDIWRTVYPPISFIVLRFFSINSCYGDPFSARSCDWVGIVVIMVSYLGSCASASVAFIRRDRSTALVRSLAFGLGWPMLFAVERGNLLLICLIPFILVYGDLLGSSMSRAVAIATTINFKPYLVVPSLALAVRRDWRGLELAGLATLAVYLVTLVLFGSGTPMEIVANLTNYASLNSRGFLWQDFYFSTSYTSTLALGKALGAPLLAFVSSRVIDTIMLVLPLVITSAQVAAVIGLAAAWLQPRALPLARNVALLVGAHLATKSPGGYTLAFLIFAVFLEKGRRPGQMVALVAAYLLSITYDYTVATVVNANATSWLGGGVAVSISFGLAVGQFLRPALVVLIVWALALDSVTVSVLAHRRTRPTLGLRGSEEFRIV